MMHYFPMAKAYSYTRFSTPEQAQGDSARRQIEAARAYAAENGLELDETLSYSDLGVSAYRGGNLDEGLGDFHDAIREGLVEPGSMLLVESLDRLSRLPPRRAVRALEDIVDRGVAVVTLSDGQRYDTERLEADPMAFMLAYLIAVRAHEESVTKGRRVAAAWAEKRRKVRAGEAKRLTKRAPAWLKWDRQSDDWTVDENRAETARRVFELTLEGLGEHKIAERFNSVGVPPLGRAKRWHRSSVAKLLRNRAVVGDLVPGRIEHRDGKRRRVLEEPIEGAFPAIVSDAHWKAVRTLKDGRAPAARGRGAKRPLANLLGGLARCPLCGSTMTRVMKGKKGGPPKLVCTKAKDGAGCTYRTVPLEPVERAVLDAGGTLMADIPAGDAEAQLDARASELEGQIAGTLDHMRDLGDALETSPSRAGAARLAKLECELETLSDALAKIVEQRRLVDGGLIRARVERLYDTLEAGIEQGREAANAALRVLFEGVTVDYQRGVLAFHWRQGGATEKLFEMPPTK